MIGEAYSLQLQVALFLTKSTQPGALQKGQVLPRLKLPKYKPPMDMCPYYAGPVVVCAWYFDLDGDGSIQRDGNAGERMHIRDTLEAAIDWLMTPMPTPDSFIRNKNAGTVCVLEA